MRLLHLADAQVEVEALGSNAVRGFAVEDAVTINLRFASGALGTFLLSDTAACPRSWEQTSQENPAYPSYADEDCYVLTGTNGSLSVPTMRLEARPLVSAHDGLVNLRVTEAITQAARTSQVIELPAR